MLRRGVTKSGRFRRAGAAALLALLLFPAARIAAEEPSVAEMGALLAERYKDRRPEYWGEHLPGVSSKLPPQSDVPDAEHTRSVALTLDACDGGTDESIIALLRQYRVPATVFVTNIWLRRNKAVAEDLAMDPLFTLACHGARHKPASVVGKKAYGITGTRSVAELVAEVENNARAITALTKKRPLWYRSGTAHYDDVALAVIADLGLFVAGYAVSADEGASLTAKEVERRLLAAPDGAIILCHCNRPESGTGQGLKRAVPAMLEKGVRFVPLTQ